MPAAECGLSSRDAERIGKHTASLSGARGGIYSGPGGVGIPYPDLLRGLLGSRSGRGWGTCLSQSLFF